MISTDVQKLQAGSIIDLYEIDATAIGGTVLRWCSDVNELNTDIVWQGETYTRFPIIVDGFARSGRGTQPRPTIKASNVAGVLGALVREFNDLVGAKFTRKRTFVKYLDAVNFAADYDKTVNRERVNLLNWSSNFDNSDWTKVRVSVVANQATAPDGSGSADKIISNGVTDPLVYQVTDLSITAGQVFTFSVDLWTDAGQPTSMQLFIYGNNYPTDGMISGKSITITNTPTRYNISVTAPVGFTSTDIRSRIDLKQNPDDGDYIYASGAQTQRGAETTYQSVRYAEGENPSADPNVGFADEVWYVDRKASEDGIFISFELASAMDLTNAKLPKRQITQNTCAWQYRSAECSYSGGAVANIMDVATGVLADDVCGHRVESCKLRFGDNAELPYGGFPGSSN
jgi:lambda family phage minor tail protein L